MPNPARRMGVNPTLGLTTEPVKALIGDCCGLVVREGAGDSPACRIGGFRLLPLVRLPPLDRDWPRTRALC
jgi:hypothetical protein